MEATLPRAAAVRRVALVIGFAFGVAACSSPTDDQAAQSGRGEAPAEARTTDSETSAATSASPKAKATKAKANPTSESKPNAEPTGPKPYSARRVLERIPVRNEHRGGYDRDLFAAGRDADGDGCDTRAEILLRDAVRRPKAGSNCRLSKGTWASAYDALIITNTHGIEVDHTVSLKEAWDSGAWRWSHRTRAAFANDLSDVRTLRPTSVGSNREKGDRDPSNWLPPDDETACGYVGDWVAIKARWKLSMDESEWGRVKTCSTIAPRRELPAGTGCES